jgi:hypothetical protein
MQVAKDEDGTASVRSQKKKHNIRLEVLQSHK